MYTGRITEVGTVLSGNGRLMIEAPKTASGLAAGGSVNVSGCCLTAVATGDTWFSVDVSAETARRSTLAALTPGEPVNLELPLYAGDRLDGHLVQGHTDAIGKVALVDEALGRDDRDLAGPRQAVIVERALAQEATVLGRPFTTRVTEASGCPGVTARARSVMVCRSWSTVRSCSERPPRISSAVVTLAGREVRASAMAGSGP